MRDFLIGCSAVVGSVLLTGPALAGIPNTTREYEGVTIQQVSEFVQTALEKRKYQIMNVDKDDDGEIVIQATRADSWGFSDTANFYRLTVRSNGRVRATVAVSTPGLISPARNPYNKNVWSDTDAAVVAAGGRAICFGKGGKEHVCKDGE